MRVRGVRDTGRTRPMESTKQGSWGFTETEVAIVESMWIFTRSSAYILWLLVLCFGGTPDSGSEGISDSFACS